MIWLTWRQFRGQTLIALAALALLGGYLIFLGLGIHDFYDTKIVGCQGDDCSIAKDLFREKYEVPMGLIGMLLIGIPAVIGIFWGAPLIARELEAGTHRLVWNQSVTRRRWLAVKLLFIAAISLVVTGLLSFVLTWAAEPFDRLVGSRFSTMTFDSRDIVPLGYAVFAFVLGTTIGLLIRRTVPAMALTVAIFAAVQILMPLALRPHLMSPITASVPFTSDMVENDLVDGIGSNGDRSTGDAAPMGLFGYTKPGAWVLSSSFLPLLRADGSAYTQADNKACFSGDFGKDMECLAKQRLHFSISYHPANRYWAFQRIESAIFLALALALAGFCFWRIPRGLT